MARKAAPRIWGIRIGVALLAGVIVGAIVGVIGVNTLDRGGSARKGTLESTIDSIANGKAQSSRPERTRDRETEAPRVLPAPDNSVTAGGVDAADRTADQTAEANATAAAVAAGAAPPIPALPAPPQSINSVPLDSIRAAVRVVPSINNVVIPDLVGLEEGTARGRLMSMGLRIGTSSFRASNRATGIVIATVPPALAYANPGSTVSLVLSNGRLPVDSTTVAASVTARSSVRGKSR